MMKRLFAALMMSVGVSAAAAAPATYDPIQGNAGLKDLIQDWTGSDLSNSQGFADILTELLGLTESASADMEALLDRLDSMDFQVLADELAALREEFRMYRYSYVGIADEAFTEDATMPAFWNLSASCEATFGEGARLARTGDIAYLLESGDLQWESLERVIFKSNVPIPYQGGLYDALVSAPVDLDGLVIYDGTADRFVAKDSERSARPACSARGA